MTRRHPWAVLGFVGLVGLAACSDEDPVAVDNATTPTSETATGPGATYVVAAGDAITAIASAHCVSADDLVVANEWDEGVGHVIHPGDGIALPAGACSPQPGTGRAITTSSSPSGGGAVRGGPTTTNEWIRRWRDGSFYTVLGDIGYYDSADPACVDAYYAANELHWGERGFDEVLSMLTAIGVTPTPAQRDDLEAWASWAATHGENYEQAILQTMRIEDPAQVEAVLASPAFADAMDNVPPPLPAGELSLSDAIEATCPPPPDDATATVAS